MPFDILDGNTSQMQLLVFLSDGRDVNHTLIYFGNGAVTVNPDTIYENLSAGFIGFYPEQAQDEIYVWMIAVDIDDTDIVTDATISIMQQGFENKVQTWITQRIIANVARTNIPAFIMGAMLDVVASVIKQPDLIGQQAFLLSRNENWNEGRYQLESDDGAISIIYSIEVIEGNNLLSPTPTRTPTRTPVPPTRTPVPQVRRFNATIDTDRLNVRYAASADTPIIYRLSKGDQVLAVGRNSNSSWILIDAGIIGWVNASYIIVEGNIAQLPNITSSARYPASMLTMNYYCAGANGPSFRIGDRFTVPYGNGASPVFIETGRASGRERQIGSIPEGRGGYIRGGPICTAAPENRYLTWYYVEADNGLSGYMNESYTETPIKAIVPN